MEVLGWPLPLFLGLGCSKEGKPTTCGCTVAGGGCDRASIREQEDFYLGFCRTVNKGTTYRGMSGVKGANKGGGGSGSEM